MTSNLAGIIANIDVMKIPHDNWRGTRVKDVMSTELAIIRAGDKVDYALNYMRRRNIGRLPVVEDNNPKKLIGIITTSDIVAAYMDSQNYGETIEKHPGLKYNDNTIRIKTG